MHKQNGIYFLDYYHPYRNGKNEEFNEFSARILDLKDKKAIGMDYFLELLVQIFQKKVSEVHLLTTVPPHAPKIEDSGIMILAKKVSQEVSNIIDGTSIIQREKEVPKLSKGGNRSLYRHVSSLILTEPDRLLGHKVIILDDITTSFNSLLACSQLIKTASVKKIIPLALGRTKPEKSVNKLNYTNKESWKNFSASFEDMLYRSSFNPNT